MAKTSEQGRHERRCDRSNRHGGIRGTAPAQSAAVQPAAPAALYELALRIRQDDGKRLFEGLDTNYLSLLLIDFLVEGGMLGRGRTHPEVLAFMAEVAQRLKPSLEDAEARKVGSEILGGLANVDNRQDALRVPVRRRCQGAQCPLCIFAPAVRTRRRQCVLLPCHR